MKIAKKQKKKKHKKSLPERLVDLERQWWANPQYLSREFREIEDISCSVDNNTLEENVS